MIIFVYPQPLKEPIMPRPKYPSDQIDKMTVRFPEGLKKRLEEAAKYYNRSLNAHIIHTLELAHPDASENFFASSVGELLEAVPEEHHQAIIDFLKDRKKEILMEFPTERYSKIPKEQMNLIIQLEELIFFLKDKK